MAKVQHIDTARATREEQELDDLLAIEESGVQRAERIGELLVNFKERCPHGEFETRLQQRYPKLSSQRASEYMRIHRAKSPPGGDLKDHAPKTVKQAIARAPSQVKNKPRKPKGALDAASQALQDAGKAPLSREETIALKVKGSLRQTIGDGVDLRDAGNAETVVDAVLNARAGHEAPVSRADLTKPEEKLLDRAIRQEIAQLRKTAAAELNAEVDRRMKPVLADYVKWVDEAKSEKEHYEASARHLEDWITYEQFQAVISCLHPDRAPAGMEEKYRRAFQIMNALKKRFK